MKKTMKKLLPLLLAVVMSLAFAGAALAEGEAGDTPAATKNDSITINNAKSGETYNIYKMFDLKVNSETAPTAYTYTVNSDWAAFFETGGAGNQYVTINEAGAVAEISDPAALAKAAAEWTGKPDATESKKPEAGATSVEFADLADGYWLVTSTLGTVAMADTTPDASAVTINEKNPEDTITKQVKEDSTNDFGKSNDAQVGDTVEFKSTVKIIKGTRNVVVHDKMTDGLTYTAGSVNIAGLIKDTEYTVNEAPDDGDTFDITFKQSWIDELDFGGAGYKEYVITYTATINDAAVVKGDNGVAIVDQNNKTHVSFGDGTSSTEDSTTTKTHKFSVYKHAKDSTANLAGAVFQVKKGDTVLHLIKLDDNNYKVDPNGTETTFTTVADGDIVIWGVDSDDDYKLNETQAPAGYNKLAADTPAITVDANNATRVDVENKSGTELPGTGGIGTTIFYIAGSALVLVAGAALFARRVARKQS